MTEDRQLQGNGQNVSRGFTLIELMIVMAIMGILITIAAPNLKQSIVRAREAVLREDLFQIREAIDQYYADNDKYPAALSDLINTQEKPKATCAPFPKTPLPMPRTGSPSRRRAAGKAAENPAYLMCTAPARSSRWTALPIIPGNAVMLPRRGGLWTAPAYLDPRYLLSRLAAPSEKKLATAQ